MEKLFTCIISKSDSLYHQLYSNFIFYCKLSNSVVTVIKDYYLTISILIYLCDARRYL